MEITGIALGIQLVMGFSATIFSPMTFGIMLDLYNLGIAFTTNCAMTVITPICFWVLWKKLMGDLEADI